MIDITDTLRIDSTTLNDLSILIPELKTDIGKKDYEYSVALTMVSSSDTIEIYREKQKNSMVTSGLGPLRWLLPTAEKPVVLNRYIYLPQENEQFLTTLDQSVVDAYIETMPSFGIFLAGHSHQHQRVEGIPEPSGFDWAMFQTYVSKAMVRQLAMKEVEISAKELIGKGKRLSDRTFMYEGYPVVLHGPTLKESEPVIFYTYFPFIITSKNQPHIQGNRITNYRAIMGVRFFDPYMSVGALGQIQYKEMRLEVYDNPSSFVPLMSEELIRKNSTWIKPKENE